MKRHTFTFLVLFIVLFISCGKDYLDVIPDDIATIDMAFENRNNAEKYLYTCYSYLPKFSSTSGNPALLSGDEMWSPDFYKISEPYRIARGFQSATSPIFDFWSDKKSNLYIAIRNCNTFLSNIDRVPDADDALKKRWRGEANFLKAYYHFYLVKMYGPVIISDKNIPVSATSQEIEVERSSIDKCFEYILSTLDKAISQLPDDIYSKSNYLGRVSKAIALAIKARVAITYASPLFNGSIAFSSLTDSSGNSLFTSSYDNTKWENAAKITKQAIDFCESIGVGLYSTSDYRTRYNLDPKLLLRATLRGRITDPWNREIIWGYSGGSIIPIQLNASPRWFNYRNPLEVRSRLSPTLRVVENYYTKNGVPIDEDKDFPYANRYNLREADPDTDKFYIGKGTLSDAKTVELNYDREPRFYADLSFDRGMWFGNGRDDGKSFYYIGGRRGEFASSSSPDSGTITGYWPKKLVSIRNSIDDAGSYMTFSKYSFPIIRLSDLYLYYAEALNESKGSPDAQVYQYIDKVRKRAGLDGVVKSWAEHSTSPSKPSTKEGMRDIIHQERLIELAFEGDRFWDLRRWMEAERYMSGPIKGFNTLSKSAEEYYSLRNLYSPNFSTKDYFWPISESEIQNNPKLKQNVGW